jgi:hypothetical protein
VRAVRSKRSLTGIALVLTVGLSLALVSSRPAIAARRPPTLRLHPSGLGPIRIGMYSEQAERVLGRPIEVEEGISDCSFWTVPGVRPGTQLIAFDGRLGYIDIYRRGPETTGGITVGDSAAALFHRYRGRLHRGRSAAEGIAGPRFFTSEHRDGATYTMEFDTYKGRVSAIYAATRHVIETFQECA